MSNDAYALAYQDGYNRSLELIEEYEVTIKKLSAALEPFAKLANADRYARWRGIIPGANIKVKDAEAAAEALNG